jgi:hypothetical protein
MAPPLQFGSKFLVVVDFAVENNGGVAIIVDQGLVA